MATENIKQPEISFKDIAIDDNGRIECLVQRDDAQHLWIELPFDYKPSPDLVALALATLAGSAFTKVLIDLPIGPNTKGAIERFTKSTVCTPEGKDVRRRAGELNALNFSGGFDSLAAKVLLPGAALISLDFGGRFSRERNFFQLFRPHVITTNIVELGLNRYSWEFMGLGALLLKDELNISTYSFGSILGGSLPALIVQPRDQRNGGLSLASPVGLSVKNPVVGLSEIASMRLAVNEHLPLVNDILNSVALPKEDKFLRKAQMLRATATVHQLPLQIDPVPESKPRREWGSSFATDLSSLYTMKVLGFDEVAETYRNGVPKSVKEGIHGLDVTFLERFNPHAYAGVEPARLSKWYEILVSHNILPYTRSDWESAGKAISLLQHRHA